VGNLDIAETVVADELEGGRSSDAQAFRDVFF